jgi:hypothetical protein
MTKRTRKPVAARRKRALSNPAAKRAPTTARRPGTWQGALERNLRAEGYSEREARELVEIAAS